MHNTTTIVLRVLSFCFRMLALLITLLVGLLLFGTSARFNLVELVSFFSAIAPFGGNAALLVLTPFGGAIHGDLCILGVLFFVLDWFCLRASNRYVKLAHTNNGFNRAADKY